MPSATRRLSSPRPISETTSGSAKTVHMQELYRALTRFKGVPG
jgi:hypothetical protein